MVRRVVTWLLLVALLACPFSCKTGWCAVGYCCTHEHRCTSSKDGAAEKVAEVEQTLAPNASDCSHGCCHRAPASPAPTAIASNTASRPITACECTPQREPARRDDSSQHPCQCLCGGAVLGLWQQDQDATVADCPAIAAPITADVLRLNGASLRPIESPRWPGGVLSGVEVRTLYCSLLC